MTPRKSWKFWSSLRRRIRNGRAKLAYDTYFITTLFPGITAIKITYLIVPSSFNNESFRLTNSLASAMVGIFFGSESEKMEGGRSYWLKFHSKIFFHVYVSLRKGLKLTLRKRARFGAKGLSDDIWSLIATIC